jgi:hypothetical protein
VLFDRGFEIGHGLGRSFAGFSDVAWVHNGVGFNDAN